MFFSGEAHWQSETLETRWETLWKLREDINKAVETLREQGVVKTNAATEVTATVTAATAEALKGVNLVELLMCAQLKWVEGATQHIEIQLTHFAKCPRCRMHTADVGESAQHPELCLRCADAENQQKEVAA